jgi:hypothetical protein
VCHACCSVLGIMSCRKHVAEVCEMQGFGWILAALSTRDDRVVLSPMVCFILSFLKLFSFLLACAVTQHMSRDFRVGLVVVMAIVVVRRAELLLSSEG